MKVNLHCSYYHLCSLLYSCILLYSYILFIYVAVRNYCERNKAVSRSHEGGLLRCDRGASGGGRGPTRGPAEPEGPVIHRAELDGPER